MHLIGTLSLILLAASSYADNVEQHLRDRYLHKTLILRGFYSGNSLHYDSSGSAPSADSGDWTVDGVVQIEGISVSGDYIKIRASRIHLGWVDNKFQPIHDQDKYKKDEKKERELRIEAAMNGPATEASVEAALSHIFLNAGDDLADFVPDYWKPCIHAASGVPSNQAPECHFSADFLAVPGVAPTGSSTHPEDQDALGAGSFHPGRGTTPPKLIFNMPPAFSEEARRAKFQGTATLRLTVDASGQPTDIHIISPIGCGLDAQAVRAVQQWKFEPSAKDGQPIAVQIAVEVDFHLY